MCMIFGENIRELEVQNIEISKKIIELTSSGKFSIDELNALRADKKHINDQISKIKGKNISEDTNRIKDRKIIFDKINIDRYFRVKNMVILLFQAINHLLSNPLTP